jgi:hypothetical protein
MKCRRRHALRGVEQKPLNADVANSILILFPTSCRVQLALGPTPGIALD